MWFGAIGVECNRHGGGKQHRCGHCCGDTRPTCPASRSAPSVAPCVDRCTDRRNHGNRDKRHLRGDRAPHCIPSPDQPAYLMGDFMNSASRRRLIAATGALTLLAGAGSAFAVQTSTITVGATVINGTRTLNVKDVSGGPVSSLALGAGHGGALLVNVSDINYAHAGYQVTATMSNLCPYDTAYHFNQAPIPSSAISLSFPGGLVDVAGL